MNNNEIDIKVIAKDLASATIKEVKNQVQGLGNETESAGLKGNILTGVVAGVTTAITSLGISIVQSGISSITTWFGDAVSKAEDFQKTMTTLAIVAPRFGVSADEAKQSAMALGEELRIGVGPAAESLQNLLKSGLNLDQANELMRRFTNEAITGKSNSISLAQAVQNLSFAYTTNNSALGNLSGISENFNDIIDRGKAIMKEQGIATDKITDSTAKYYGMIALTNLTLGSSAQFTGTLIDKQAQLTFKMDQFQTKIGTLLMPILSQLYDIFTQIFDDISPYIQEWAEKYIPKIGEWLRDTIVPKVKQFMDYLMSDQFKTDIKSLWQTFKDIKDFAADIASHVSQFVGGLSQELQNSKFANNSTGITQHPVQFVAEAVATGGILPLLRGLNILPKYASGTDYHPGGLAIVGEREPEVVNLPRGASVTPMSRMPSITNNFYGYNATDISNLINTQLKFN